jgi:hypothetical protein
MSQTSKPTPVDQLLDGIVASSIPEGVFSDDAVLDATVPNWRLSVSGGEAVRSQLAQWYADPGEFQTLRRTPLPQGELVEFTLTWAENGVPHTCHQAHILEIADGLVSTDTMWCGGRSPGKRIGFHSSRRCGAFRG